MNITYLNHSGFLLEWETCYWLFDYYKGVIPELNPEKELFIFSSHSHGDHFNPEVFDLENKCKRVTYIFSVEIRNTCEEMKNASNNVKKIPEIIYVESRMNYELKNLSDKNLVLHTLQSTDLGCAFLIEYEGKVIYHAGDLHWWYWIGEPDDWNEQMTLDYKNEMEYLKGKEIDLAFTPVDPRLGETYAWGINYLLENTHIKHVIPMHFWDDFSICKKYAEEYSIPQETEYHLLSEDGQELRIVL